MTFPAVPRDVAVEIFVNGAWTNISADVRTATDIVIGRGRHNYSGVIDPSSATLSLLNTNGNYSPRNPTGAYYGYFNRGTPIRISINRGADPFTRTVSNGWGSSPTAGAWTTVLGSGGTVQASDYQVTGTGATLSLPVANSYRLATLPGATYQDIDFTAQVTVPFTTVTGNPIYPLCLVVRGASAADFVYGAVTVDVTGAIYAGIFHFDGTTIAANLNTGLTHAATTPIMCRVQAEGHTYRIKVWQGAAEPGKWTTTGHFTRDSVAGFIGIMGVTATGNTNTYPVVLTYDNATWRQPRFTGEISSITVRWDTTGNLVWTDIEAGGIKRRLGSNASPLLSSARRGLASITTAGNTVGADVVAWWPLEDATDVDPTMVETAYSSTSGADPAYLQAYGTGGAGLVNFAGATDAPGAPAAMTISPSGDVYGEVGNARAITQLSTSWGASWALKVDPTKTATVFLYCDPNAATQGSSGWKLWVNYLTTGAVELRLDDIPNHVTNVLLTTVTVTSGGWVEHDWHHYLVSAHQNGTGVDWTLWVDGTQVASGTVATSTMQPLTQVNPSGTSYSGGGNGPFSVSHIVALKNYPAVWNASTISTVTAAVLGHQGELAGNRLARILGEEGISFSYIGNLSDTPAMGPQQTDTLLNIVESCADADLGPLYEPCGDIGFAYRTRTSTYNQASAFTLDYSAGQVGQPFEPVDDDQQTVNDVRVTRTNGGTARSVVTTGRLAAIDPTLGGVGTYAANLTLDVASDNQLPNIASWLSFVGTVDETRYPIITVDLANSAVVAAGLDAAVLALGINNRLSIVNPFAKQAPDQINLLAWGYYETLNVYTHTFAINCGPASPYDLLQIGTTGKAYIDSDASTVTGGPYTSSATSIQVASTAGMVWVTGSGLSIPILVAGEVMTVTAITGSTSPQTFTVTRSTNGVQKTQQNGASVRVARRSTVGL